MRPNTVNQTNLDRAVQPPVNGNLLEKSDLTEVVESLSKALDILEVLKEAGMSQFLNVHTHYFPEKGIDFFEATKTYEIILIKSALRITRGNQTKAAKLLNLKLSTLNSIIKRYDIRF